MKRFYPVAKPSITAREMEYVNDAMQSGWVSSMGRYIDEFEREFARYCGVSHAIATSSGTTALHLALVSAGVGAGAEVIIPDFTFVATANAAHYTGATIVPVDIDGNTLCIDPSAVMKAISPSTRAIVPVHMYGMPADMDRINDIAQQHKLLVVEDAAQAHGSEYRGRRVGSLGDCGVFSFYGSKLITCGEGGMITCDDGSLAERARYLRDQAMSPSKRYWHTEVGYNYRMTNLQAALGLAQLGRIDELLERKREIMDWYRARLGGHPGLKLNAASPSSKSNYWMVYLVVDGMTESTRDRFMEALRGRGIDSRPFFYPVSEMPMYATVPTPVTRRVAPTGVVLPSYFDLSRSDVDQICDHVLSLLPATIDRG